MKPVPPPYGRMEAASTLGVVPSTTWFGVEGVLRTSQCAEEGPEKTASSLASQPGASHLRYCYHRGLVETEGHVANGSGWKGRSCSLPRSPCHVHVRTVAQTTVAVLKQQEWPSY